MVSPDESTSPSNSQSDLAFIKAVIQRLMDVGNGRVMELTEAKAKLSSGYLNIDAKYLQETSANLKMLEQSRQAIDQGKTISCVEAFSELRRRRG
jgi:hypothetical protein